MDLIERDGFFELLQTKLESVASGEGHCVLISGEAGIGKTSIVKAFYTDKKSSCNIYLGTCDDLFTPRPLAPLYDMLIQMQVSIGENNGKVVDRVRLFTGFLNELENQTRTTLIIIEDVHWADEATLDFIKFLARRINQFHCLFILTYRDNEIRSNHPLRTVFGQLPPDSFTRLRLTPLSREAVEKMAKEKGFKGENVYSISGGNPFYVTEILASYSVGVPSNIKDSILSTYNRVDDETKSLWRILSVSPTGFELKYLERMAPSYAAAIHTCLELQIMVLKDRMLLFKHELFRRTIESSLSPMVRIALNKKIIDLFKESFEQNREIERIIHHAKNANEYELVVTYAPMAAKQAASLGSHIEASKLYFTAIEYYQGYDKDLLIQFYEAYAYECYLINEIRNAIIYQGKALKILQEKKQAVQVGNSLRVLSRLWWYDGNRDEAEKYGNQAIEILQSQPSSRAKAMAFSNMSQLKLFSGKITECVEWGNMAVEIAKELKDDDMLCHALNNVGSGLWKIKSSEETGKKLLMESLDIALRNSYHEQAARAYSNIITYSLLSKDYDFANQFLQDSISYCEERDLDFAKNYNLYLQSRFLMETGDWNQAVSIVQDLLANSNQPNSIKIGALAILSTIKLRRGETDTLVYLDEARALASIAKEYQRTIPVMIAVLECEWLLGKKFLSDEEINGSADLITTVGNVFQNSEIAFWLEKAKRNEILLPELYEPYKALKAGRVNEAVTFWDTKGCPFEKALALFEGNENDKRSALSILQGLGADAVYEKLKMEMRASGIKKIPRGQRESTKTNPAQLTNRELDVLQLLKNGGHNKEIAETLFISSKTVDNHISSIFFKLNVNSRVKAVKEAIGLNIIK
ncbi:MAG TPA: AAA family ATPase [Flavitalea sp.]|nr:AAA family ATPase [Flavitalea sp.]